LDGRSWGTRSVFKRARIVNYADDFVIS
jgi:hypothetical protein